MFRIPDYVAEIRLDGAPPPAVRADGSTGRSITRLAGVLSGAGQRLAQAEAARRAETADQTEPAFPAEPARPPSAEERRLADHMRRRQAQAGKFATERRYLDLQAEADAAEGKARAEAGPSGEGFTRLYSRELGLIGHKLRSSLPARVPDEQRAEISARFEADQERRLARAAAEEVESGREQTRAELAGMQAALLAQLAREPERYEEIAAQGAAFTAGNILPEAETQARVADWYERAETVRAAAAEREAAAERGVGKPVSGAGPAAGRDDERDAEAERLGLTDTDRATAERVMREADEQRLEETVRPLPPGVKPAQPMPGPDARAYLRDHPETLADFIARYGADQLPQSAEFAAAYEGGSVLQDLRAASARPGEPNPYAEVDRNEVRASPLSPFARSYPGRLGSATGAFVQEGADVAATAPKALAINHAEHQRTLLQLLRQRDQGARNLKIPEGQIRWSDLVRITNATPEERRRWIAELESSRFEDQFLYRLGDAITEGAERHFPVNPLYEDEFQQKLARMGGALAGYALIGLTTRGLGMGGASGAAIAGSANQKVALFEEALANGASIEDAFKAGNHGAVIGLSEALPISRLLDRLDKGSGGSVRRALIEALKGGGENALQDTFQTIAGNLVASGIVGYDPERELFTGTGEEAGASFTVGAFMSFAASIFGGKAVRKPGPRKEIAAAGAGSAPPAADTLTDLAAAPAGGKAPIPPRSAQAEVPDKKPRRHNFIVRLNAQRELAIFKKNADKVFDSATAPEYFGPLWDRLPPHMQDFLEKRYTNFVGRAGHNIISRRLDEAGFGPGKKKTFDLPSTFKRSQRIYDETVSQKLKLSLLDLIVRPVKSNLDVGIEAKVASSRNREQERADAQVVRMNDLAGVETLRMPADRIKTEDLADVIESWLDRRKGQNRPGSVPRQDVMDLIDALRTQSGPDGRPLTIGQVSLVVLGATLPLLYPSETGEAERAR